MLLVLGGVEGGFQLDLELVMKLLHAAAALLLVLSVAGCAGMAPKPAATATPAPSGPVYSVMPPMTMYGCDTLIAHRMGKPC